ncbi:MAG: UDP-N-acetylglucosamine--N-acetylmuramyl-(pentapeptide) pyrophosphoryl-undecaprenol N-acetylglucosamine transferase [bacterium ADurb.Bin363]|nr:MAG: UDP-N-acetylglucosamine--N-acetylmuramyl-(pentapeptide) pyrophosphoryl-undecaprenol N-acetylglucosamine transferase [bacterium ADurb.Bin363]
MGIPLVAHESDTVPGLSNRILLRFVRKLSLGFPLNNYPLSIQKKSEYTGNPINPCVLEISKKSKDDAVRHFGFNLKEPVLLVTGGSQGARAINDAIWAIKDKLLETLQIIHICGNLDYEKLNNSLSDISSPLKNRYKLFAFLSDDMPQALLASDLVITRAGANTLSELIILKKPSIIIPLPKAANDHQRKNGRVLSDCGAALFIDQSQLTPELLMNNILRLFSDSHLLQDMSEKTALMAKPDSAELIAKTILDVAGVGEVKNEK